MPEPLLEKGSFTNPAAYQQLFGHHEGYQSRFLKLLADSAVKWPEKILDLGSGVGDFSRLLSIQFPGASVLGLDSSHSFVEQAKISNTSDKIVFDVHPASKLLTREDVREVDTIFIKGCYHLFEQELPLLTFLDPRFHQLRAIVIIEKSARSLDTYPVPHESEKARSEYVSLNLGRRRLSAPPNLDIKSFSYGEWVNVPIQDYVRAVRARQFSYLNSISEESLSQWEARVLEFGNFIPIFEENVATVYYPK